MNAEWHDIEKIQKILGQKQASGHYYFLVLCLFSMIMLCIHILRLPIDCEYVKHDVYVNIYLPVKIREAKKRVRKYVWDYTYRLYNSHRLNHNCLYHYFIIFLCNRLAYFLILLKPSIHFNEKRLF